MSPTCPCRVRVLLMSTLRQNYPVPGSREPQERLLGSVFLSVLIIGSVDDRESPSCLCSGVEWIASSQPTPLLVLSSGRSSSASPTHVSPWSL
jgi:hypothetical protein